MGYMARMRGAATTRVVTALAAIGIGFASYTIGHRIGYREGHAPQQRLEQLAKLPVADGMLAYPRDYDVRAQENAAGETEAYLLDKRTGAEYPLSAKAPQLLRIGAAHPWIMEHVLPGR